MKTLYYGTWAHNMPVNILSIGPDSEQEDYTTYNLASVQMESS